MKKILNMIFSFKGCIDRPTYIFAFMWIFVFYVILLLISAYFTVGLDHVNDIEHIDDKVYLTLYFSISIAMTYNAIVLAAKRFKDMGLSPYNSLLLIIPFISILTSIIIMFIPSKKENNIYC